MRYYLFWVERSHCGLLQLYTQRRFRSELIQQDEADQITAIASFYSAAMVENCGIPSPADSFECVRKHVRALTSNADRALQQSMEAKRRTRFPA